MKFKGRKYFIVKEKLKILRERLRWWNKEIFGWIGLQVEDKVEELNKLKKELLLGASKKAWKKVRS